MNPKSQIIVLDSCVFAKIFLDEDDRDEFIALLEFIQKNSLKIVCPDIFVYEVLSVASRNKASLKDVLALIRKFERSNLDLRSPTASQFELAMKMTEEGHVNAGFPSIYDCTYHAFALSLNGQFITSEKKHMAKTTNFG